MKYVFEIMYYIFLLQICKLKINECGQQILVNNKGKCVFYPEYGYLDSDSTDLANFLKKYGVFR